ncbi:hypothetical protein JK628_05525 [Shewanella sp. KX20019]|nr:hypothetical protein [Shewanella sp. KX20019]QQX81327.1 hypothetical protein JK628_05525 [Shewanella sp. KX20019]
MEQQPQPPAHLEWQFEHYPERSHMSGNLPASTDGLESLFSESKVIDTA